MAVGPAFEEAAKLAKAVDMPCGVHLTLACEWNKLRWGPLTDAPSLRSTDGCFPLHVSLLNSKARSEEVEAEVFAQIQHVLDAGLRVTHIDAHISVYSEQIQARVCRSFGLPSRDPLESAPDLQLAFDERLCLSPMTEKRKRQLLAELAIRGKTARILLVTHPSVDGIDLCHMCTPEPSFTERVRWARDYRITDYNALLDFGPIGSDEEINMNSTVCP